MSARLKYVLECDGCGTEFDADKTKAFETRDVAARHGWTHVVPERAKRIGPVKSRDYCDTCSKERMP